MDGDTIGTSQRRYSDDTTDDRMTHDATDAVTATYDPPRRTFSQDAFGNVLSGSSDGFHLTTKRHYSAIGLYYFYQRWLEPNLGRFSKQSPYPMSIEHPYVYCENNAANLTDPEGRFSRQAGELCLHIAKKIPNTTPGACGTDAAVDCKQAEDCLRKLKIDPTNEKWCHYEVKEIGVGDFGGVNWCVHAYCGLVCDESRNPSKNLK